MIDLNKDGPKILDVTCGDRQIWFQKNEPHTVYCDNRKERYNGKTQNNNGQPVFRQWNMGTGCQDMWDRCDI